MNQRKSPLSELDYFPTPPWATRALCEKLQELDVDIKNKSAWDCASGGGHMIGALAEYFGECRASDIHDYGAGAEIRDFLSSPHGCVGPTDWIITNPPFKLALEFTLKALGEAEEGVAMFCRTNFIEGQKRYAELYKHNPPTIVLQFVERVALVKNRVDPKATSATAYAWFVWLKKTIIKEKFISLSHIEPCRQRLERDSDYKRPPQKQ